METLKKVLFIIALFTSITGKSQPVIDFSYDDAGNRIARTVIPFKKNAYVDNDSTAASRMSIIISGYDVLIFPNPTKGELMVQIVGEVDLINSELIVFNIEGKSITIIKPLNSVNTINISDYPNGVYITRIKIGGDYKEWKIIKE